MKYIPTHDKLSSLELWRIKSYLLGRSIANSFVQKVPLQIWDIGHSLFYTFQLRGSGDFDCQ